MRAKTLTSTVRVAALRSSSLALGLGMALTAPALADTEASKSVVVVTGHASTKASQQSGLDKLTQPLIDTPQSVSVISRIELDDRGITTLSDALRTTPGISLGAGETSFQGNNVILRGFTTRNDTYLDGMRDYGYYYRDPFDEDSIEVLKGPSSVLFGRGSTGGVIEQTTKHALVGQHFLDAQVQVGTDQTHRLTVDANTLLGDGLGAVRLNAMVHESGVARRDGARNSRWGLAPSLLINLSPNTQMRIDWLHQFENDRPDYGIPWFNGAPAKVDRSHFYGFSSDYLRATVNVLTAAISHQVNDSLTLSSKVRYSDDSREFRTSEAVVPSGVAATTPLSMITLNRNEFAGYSREVFLQDQSDLTAKFSTGPLKHSLAAGFEVGSESPRPTYIFFIGVPTTNLANPPPQTFSAALAYVRLTARTDAGTAGVYGLDTIDIGDHWQVMGGVRWDRFDAHYTSTGFAPTGAVAARTDIHHVDAAPSYRAAVVYKAKPGLNFYVSYGDSFDPSASGIESLVSSGRSVAQANLNLAPEKSRSYEAGAKWAVTPQLVFNASVFKLEKTNVRVPDPATPGFNTLGGDQQVQGFETELSGALTAAWKVHLGYAYMDSQTMKSAPGGPLAGAALTITPKNTFSLATEYKILPNVEVGGDLVSMSSRLGQNTAASYLTAPGYTVAGLMAKYIVSNRFSVQVNLYNVTDAVYYDQLHPFHVVPGAGRSAMLTVSGHF